MRIKVTQASLPPTTEKNILSHIRDLTRQGNRSPTSQLGKQLVPIIRKERARLHIFHHVRPRVSLLINDSV